MFSSSYRCILCSWLITFSLHRTSHRLRVLELRSECRQGLMSIVRKVQDKSPLKYWALGRWCASNPQKCTGSQINAESTWKGWCKGFSRKNNLPILLREANRRLHSFHQFDWPVVPNDYPTAQWFMKIFPYFHFYLSCVTGDVILQQYDRVLSLERQSIDFLSFPPMQKRLDLFLSGVLKDPYPELWAFCQKLLLLSQGQATVERGFSINKEVECDNVQEDTVVTQRLVCADIIQHGGVTQVRMAPGWTRNMQLTT